MTKINEFAEAYESKATKNISELSKVPVDAELKDDEFEVIDKQTGQTKIVKQKVINLNGEDYRVPISVISQLKVFLEDNKDLKFFKVKMSGEGMKTSYQVIPMS